MDKTQQRYANIIPMAELATPEKRLNPFPEFARLREQSPVRYDAARQAWDLFLYEDVHRVLSDPATFSSQRGMGMRNESLLTMDPPRHTQLRNLVNKAFTPKAIADLAPRIEAITNELLDDVIESGRMDFVHDFATPLPVIVIAELLGVPAEDRRLFKDWSDIAVSGPEGQSEEEYAAVMRRKGQAMEELSVYFAKIIAQRRAEAQDDLITALVQAEIDGEQLTDQEVISFCILLLVAGNETTTNLITNTVRRYSEVPELQELNRGHEKLIQTTVEEILRFYPPIVAIGRVATQDVEIRGQQIKAGDQVVSWTASANRDGNKFDRPEEFVPDRKPNPHMGFGFGIHFCLGAPLARLEAQVCLRVLLDRVRNIRFVEGSAVRHIPSPFVYGVKSYPITFDRA